MKILVWLFLALCAFGLLHDVIRFLGRLGYPPEKDDGVDELIEARKRRNA